MCGIGVYVARKGSARSEVVARIRKVLGSLEKRGPDHSGFNFIEFSNSSIVCLLHTRLSILDLDARSNQPMRKHGIDLVFNGEIFNWRELRSSLVECGYKFETQSDSEVVIAAYHMWGESCIDRFNGFWALAIVDERNPGKVFLSRDRSGIKPLYMMRGAGSIYFASEIAAIREMSGEKLVVSQIDLATDYVLENKADYSRTIYEGISSFPHGSNGVLDIASLHIDINRYWCPEHLIRRVDACGPISERGLNDYIDEFAYLIEDAVRLRSDADVPIALSLSGGIDSSVIACAAAENGNMLDAFSIYFGEADKLNGESVYARRVAEALGIRLQLVNASTSEVIQESFNLGEACPDLYTSFSQLSNWFVAKAIKKMGIKVVLNGQGGDELFFGYKRYMPTYIRRSMEGSMVTRLKRCVESNASSYQEMIGLMAYFGTSVIRKKRYLGQAKKIGLSDSLINLSKTLSVENYHLSMKELVLRESDQGTLQRLLKFDDNIMGAFGLEGRPAFLDHRLIEFSYRLPESLYVKDGWSKYIERRYLHRKGLGDIAFRRKKLGFPALTQEWGDALSDSQHYQDRHSLVSGILPVNHPSTIHSARLREKVIMLVTSLSATLVE